MMNDYFIILLPLIAIWSLLFLLCSQTWQLSGTFIPFCILGLYAISESWKWILLTPLLSVLVLDMHIILSEPKFNKPLKWISYVFTFPLLIIWLIYGRDWAKTDNLFSTAWLYLFQVGLIIYAGKFWFVDVILLFSNRLSLTKKEFLETNVRNKFITKSGRAITFNVVFSDIGKVETSGFFYLYLKIRNVDPHDKIQLVLKKGWLGTEYISGFPIILSRSDSE